MKVWIWTCKFKTYIYVCFFGTKIIKLIKFLYFWMKYINIDLNKNRYPFYNDIFVNILKILIQNKFRACKNVVFNFRLSDGKSVNFSRRQFEMINRAASKWHHVKY